MKFEFKVEYLKNGHHFSDDKDIDLYRDIYKITISRNSRSYTFDFGQSINNSRHFYDKVRNLKFYETNIDYRATYGAKTTMVRKDKFFNWIYPMSVPIVNEKILRQAKVLIDGTEPRLYDTLTCLQKYDVGTFEDFCSEFGFDEDSHKSEKIYQSLLEEWKNVKILFSDEELETLREIV